MTQLLGPNGQPISSFKKAAAPALGEQFGKWSGENVDIMKLPGGGLIGFDLDQLTLSDFSQMKDHYQINSSLAILTFMMHQVEWHIECDDKKLADQAQEMLSDVWSRLVRAKSQAFWAGYSPNVLQWENDVQNRAITLTKVKDLMPGSCSVNWKKINPDGSSASDSSPLGIKSTDGLSLFPENGSGGTIAVYDGIKQHGWAKPIPTENSYWYPLLMENGNYYGRKLLRPAFQSWFFSILLHLFSNRYYERFGEPTPVGRAPYDDTLTVDGKEIQGNKVMEGLLSQLRNRSAVIMPNDRTPAGEEREIPYDYNIEYLESQMRGADFERYMTRLDEEMSLALFTPILAMRTADVGSYNLGEGQMQTYNIMLNAITGDWAHYINRYILRPIAKYNSPKGDNHPKIRIVFTKLGKANEDLVRDVIRDGVLKGKLKVDVQELSEKSGMTVTEVKQLTQTDDQLAAEAEADKPPATDTQATSETSKVLSSMMTRVAPQVERLYRNGGLKSFNSLSLGHGKQLAGALRSDGVEDSSTRAVEFFSSLNLWINDAEDLSFETSEAFMRAFGLAMTEFTHVGA